MTGPRITNAHPGALMPDHHGHLPSSLMNESFVGVARQARGTAQVRLVYLPTDLIEIAVSECLRCCGP